MIQTLNIIFCIPAVAIGICFWFVPSKKIKWSWAAVGIAYTLVYLAVFHFWLKAF